MNKYNKYIKDAINAIMDTECNIKLSELGIKIKKNLYEKKILISFKKKKISPNTYIKYTCNNLKTFISNYTDYQITKFDNDIYCNTISN